MAARCTDVIVLCCDLIRLRDLWLHTDLPFSGSKITAKLASHEHKFYILKK